MTYRVALTDRGAVAVGKPLLTGGETILSRATGQTAGGIVAPHGAMAMSVLGIGVGMPRSIREG